MIVFGTHSRIVPGGAVPGAVCASCGRDALRAFTAFPYFHVYWIPVTPYGRKLGTECTQCQQTLFGDELPVELRQAVQRAGAVARVPKILFTGLALLLALFVYLTIEKGQYEEAVAVHLAAPRVGDAYVLDLRGFVEGVDHEMPFGVLEVERVAEGTVDLRLGGFVYEDYYDAVKAVRGGDTRDVYYFTDQQLVLARDRLPDLREDRTLRSVIRPE